MSGLLDHGITVSEISPMDQPIGLPRDTTAAFIGRTLRGPVNEPVAVDSLAAFTRRFGGLWHRSSLSYAVEQFFQHGGRRLYVVRVVNNARGAQLRLAGSDGPLLLRAAEPGSTESIRAAVDYDGIADDEHFNLNVQRLSPESGVVVDQEIYERISCHPDSGTYVAAALADSALVDVCEPVPASRPVATMGRYADTRTPYALPVERGTDGGDLCDYDLVGSAVKGTGLFCLNGVDDVDLLYMPPPAADREPGPTALLAAELYCRKRGAMLIVDPPAAWDDPQTAANGMRHAGFASANILSYFPRLAGTPRSRAAGGAIAGLLCKLDALSGPWSQLDDRRYALARGLRAARDVSERDAQVLTRAGLNVIGDTGDGRLRLLGDVTLGQVGQGDRQFARLSARRLCLALAKAIDRATRWAVFDPDRAHAAARVGQQVEEYMSVLAGAGAFAGARYSVQCDARPDARRPGGEYGVTVLLGFQPAGSEDQVSLTLYQTAAGCRVASTAFAPVAEPAATFDAA